MTGMFVLDTADEMLKLIQKNRYYGQGAPPQQAGLTAPPGQSSSTTGRDAILDLASQVDETGHAHMVKASMNGPPPPAGSVPRARTLRHGAKMNSHGQWEVLLDPDQYAFPYVSTDRALTHRHWWQSIHIPMHPSEVGHFLMSIVESGLHAGDSLARTFWFNIQDLNHHLVLGWDHTLSGLNKWIHILWRFFIIGAIAYGVIMAAPLLGLVGRFISFLWDIVTSILGVGGEALDWLMEVVESLVDMVTSLVPRF